MEHQDTALAIMTLHYLYSKQDEIALAFVTRWQTQLIGSFEIFSKLLSMQVSQSGGLSRL
jgi:hypothetical protein